MQNSILISPAVAIALCANVAIADLGDELSKVIPNDGEEEDRFGYAMAVDAHIAVIGAWHHDYIGAAYLYDIGDPENPVELSKIVPEDGEGGDRFGYAVAVLGTTALIGAYRVDSFDRFGSFVSDSGAAYLFDISDPVNPIQVTKLLPDEGSIGSNFGFAVGLGGTPGHEVALVGMPGSHIYGPASGAAYLFDVSTGELIMPLVPIEDATVGWFGISVDMSGKVAIVGASFTGYPPVHIGSAYLFDATTGEQIAVLSPKDGGDDDEFGGDVAISGDIAVVSSHRNDANGSNAGAAYLFDVPSGSQRAKLMADDGQPADYFGSSVAIHGRLVAVGAIGNDDIGQESGSIYVFDVNTSEQLALILPEDVVTDDHFGFSCAISDIAILAGSPDDNVQGEDSGSAYLFDRGILCPADLNLDGTIDFADLLELLASWGMCEVGVECPADLNDDDAVGFADLLLLLDAWGACP